MSWKPEVRVSGDPKFYQNTLAFATKEEAEASARNLFDRWMQAVEWRATESDQPVTSQLFAPTPTNKDKLVGESVSG